MVQRQLVLFLTLRIIRSNPRGVKLQTLHAIKDS